MLARDRGRLVDAARRAARVAARLGRAGRDGAADRSRAHRRGARVSAGPTHNSLDAVSDRDFAAEIAFACALTGVHLSRLGEELVLWSTTEFGFVRLGEGYCSGSSLMPQKRNPDIAELLRGKPGARDRRRRRAADHQQGPDARLQQGSAGDAGAALRRRRDRAAVAGGAAGPDRGRWSSTSARMRAAAGDPALGATDLAEELVRGGMPFRTRARDGRAASSAAPRRSSVSLRELGAADLRAIDAALSPKMLEALDPARAVAARDRSRRPGARRGRARGRAARGRAARARARALARRRC